MIGKWIPPDERSLYTSFIFAGAQAGTVLAMPLSGWLADNVNWESVFYVFGTLGCIWFIFYAFLVFDTPEEHPRISNVQNCSCQIELLL
jgi:MFS family permease